VRLFAARVPPTLRVSIRCAAWAASPQRFSYLFGGIDRGHDFFHMGRARHLPYVIIGTANQAHRVLKHSHHSNQLGDFLLGDQIHLQVHVRPPIRLEGQSVGGH